MIPKLTIPSDQNELSFVQVLKTKTETLYEYEFTKSETKEGMKMTISEKELTKEIKKGTFI